MAKDKRQKVTIEEKDYVIEDLSNIQQYMFKNIVDLEQQLATASMRLDQLKIAKAEFGRQLALSVKETETPQ